MNLFTWYGIYTDLYDVFFFFLIFGRYCPADKENL